VNTSARLFGSVRVRTTLAAGLVVGLALIVASVALVVLLGRSLTANVRDGALSRAVEVAAADGSGLDLDAGEPDDEFVQVLDADGRVVASSANVAGHPVLARLAIGAEIRLRDVQLDGSLEGSAFLVVAVGTSQEGRRSVLVGRSLDDVREATSAVIPLLVVGVPILVLIVGAVTWWITGRALRPVESIRTEVDAISAGGLDRRVPEPPTGDEVARLASTMNAMLGRLESSQARQRRFVSDAAHELRSPVASIRQHSEVAIEHPDAASVGDLARVVHQENLRVEQLVDDLLLLARLDEGADAAWEQVDLDDVVLAEAARLRGSTELTVGTTGVSAARVVGDAAGLERVVRNLGDNAARHAERTVELSVRAGDGWATVGVDDDGAGITPGDRERVFDRFVRLDDARSRDGGGSGLGLAIVRAVVDAHGGEITIGDGDLAGAHVEVRLPMRDADPD
jgi:signal transduction histidine kinase